MLTDSTRFRRQALLSASAAFGLAFILWNVPQLSFLVYPFRLFVTFVHETGHGLAAILTGGALAGFVVNADGTGFARTTGGSLALILPAGYLGAALFGAVLFTLVNRFAFTRIVSIALGVMLIAITLLYTGLLSVAFLVGLASGALLILLGWKGGRTLNLIVLNLLALLTALHALLDLLYLVGNSSAGLGSIRNDAAAFSAALTPLIPASVWAAVWAFLAVLMFAAAIYVSLVHPLRRRRPPTAAERVASIEKF